MHTRLEPKIFAVIREGYSRKQFYSDLAAGTTVGIVALPLAIAFAIASGVKPEQGLFTAIVAGFVISVLGGSRAQISGPTGAFVVIIYGIVQQYGYDGLAVATLIAGVLLILMGLFRMGALLKFIPYPVTVGFTTGIALIIFSSQLGDFLGFDLASPPAGFVEKLQAYRNHISELNVTAVLIGVVSLLVIGLWPRITHRVPGMLIAIFIGTLVVKLFNLPVATIGSRFGSVPNHLPLPHLPVMSLSLVKQMFSPAVTIAFLAALESLLAAVVADGMLGTQAPLQHGTSSSRVRQYWIDCVRRNSCYRRYCSNCHEHKKRRSDTCGRNDSCSSVVSDPVVLWEVCGADSDAHLGRNSHCRRLQHE